MKEATELFRAGDVERLARLAPHSSSLAQARGVRWLLENPGNVSEAIVGLSSAVQDPEASPVAWHALGFVLFRQEEFARALVCYRRAAELHPTDAEIRFHTGQLLLKMGQAGPALAELGAAVRWAPGEDKYRRALVKAMQFIR